MSGKPESNQNNSTSRRKFIKTSSLLVAGGAVAGQLSLPRTAHAFGSDEIRIGLVGCGGRGTGAASQAMNTEGQTRLVAMADVFSNQLQSSLRGLKGEHKDKVDVPQDRQFIGLDAYKKVLESDIDLVILATPPGFRPLHFEAAINAGKHVFMEKPVATDPAGVRRVLKVTEEAKKKNLAVAVGLQRRHERRYMETIKRLQDGAIGDIVVTRAYWNGDGVWVRPRTPEQTELEYQMRNWYYFNWLCGDHICEQHIHNLDVINWLKNGYPVAAQGQGGRQVRTGKDYGQIFDHHVVEFEYGDNSICFSQCRHIPNTWPSVSEHAHGTNGSCNISGATIYDSKGNVSWAYGRGGGGGHQQEHHDLFAVLRKGERPNEGEYGALSTMTSILGRMATYSGQKIEWEKALNSDMPLADFDALANFDNDAPVKPDADGNYPIPMPGKTKVM
ncbi:MAG: Gfo/Idh/MocA family oxidoreductase [Planctomycetales bacterium]|nr:Gfo/Idh/MocA family oxidoreductase [Planctomycetales bacterium]